MVPAQVTGPDWAIFDRAMDKYSAIQAAQDVGAPVPRTIDGRSLDYIFATMDEEGLIYPVVMKPRIRGDGILGTVIVSSNEELAQTYKEFEKIGKLEPLYDYQRPLIQEFLTGMIYDCCTLSKNGELKAVLTMCRVRTQYPYGGAGVVDVSTKDLEIVEYSRRLLRELDWTGPAEIEWIKTRDGSFKLMEVNPRFWGTVQLSIVCGIDFPRLAMRMYAGDDLGIVDALDYEEGIKVRWVLDELLSVLRDRGNFGKRLLEYINPMDIFNRKVHYSFSLTDAKPHLYTLTFEVLDRLITKLSGRKSIDA